MNTLLNFGDAPEQREHLWRRLSQRQLVQGDLPVLSVDQNSVSQAWYIRVMLGFAGWLGALFLMAFIGIGFSFVMDSAIASICIGIALCTLSYVLFRSVKNQDFLEQFSLAVSLAGQGFFFFGLIKEFREDSITLYAAILVLELLLTICVPNFIHRFLTSLAAICAAYFLLQRAGIYGQMQGVLAIAVLALWWSPRLLRQAALWRPVSYALAIALVCSEGGRFVQPFYWRGTDLTWMKHGWLIGSSLVSIALMIAVILVLRREQLAFSSSRAIAALSATVLLCGFSYITPGLSSALLLMLIAFSFSNRILLGLGLLALLSFLSHYYYQLQVTLLYKSMVLLGLASSLFAIRWLLLRLFPQAELVVEEGV
ncbi:DUF4401 domain-containing protein [Undibacterium sp. Di24W]|uniref:DUF4401 domain-containing protein n=1 Tax=Undibacterium sp. Di24W TaxID=3413033 RepID=UPI003BEF96E4